MRFALFQEKKYDCMFTLSPLDRPADLGERLERRGFTEGLLASAMVYDPSYCTTVQSKQPRKSMSRPIANMTFGRMSCAVDSVMTRRWARVGRDVLSCPRSAPLSSACETVHRRGTTLVYSQYGMGYVDHVATLPEHRRKGVASAMVARAVADSQAMGNRWTTLETTTGQQRRAGISTTGIPYCISSTALHHASWVGITLDQQRKYLGVD